MGYRLTLTRDEIIEVLTALADSRDSSGGAPSRTEDRFITALRSLDKAERDGNLSRWDDVEEMTA